MTTPVETKDAMERQFLASAAHRSYATAVNLVTRLQYYRTESEILWTQSVENRKEIGRLRGLVGFVASWGLVLKLAF